MPSEWDETVIKIQSWFCDIPMVGDNGIPHAITRTLQTIKFLPRNILGLP